MKYYFTFGSGHHDTHGRSLMGYYVAIEAPTPITARKIMFDHFGPKWSFQYTEEQFQGQAEKYGLQEEWIDGIELCCGVEQLEYLELKEELERLKEGSTE